MNCSATFQKTRKSGSKILISFARFLLLIDLNIEDPIKPQPIIEIVSNIKNFF